jgi:hypothetical protein
MDVQQSEAVANPNAAQEAEPFFELGGPAYRFMQRIGIINSTGPCIGRRITAFIAITWVPLLLFTTVEGHAIGPTPRGSFLLDFATHARLLIAVPLIFAAEQIAGPRIMDAEIRFARSGIVPDADHSVYLAAVGRARRRRDATLPEVSFLALAMIGTWFATVDQLGGLDETTWHSIYDNGAIHLTLAGVWYHLAAIPLVQFFLLRWLWRLTIWTLFLWEISRLRLNLLATHSDRAGGLGFLGVAHAALSIFPFAVSCVIAAEIAFRVQFEGLDLATLRGMGPMLIVYILIVEVVTFGPLLVMVPVLARVRREGLHAYGMLVQRHNEMFHTKWIDGKKPVDELPLGNADMSSLIDLGSSFDTIRQMSVFPVGRKQLIEVAVTACIPGLPILFQVLPVSEFVRLIASAVT